MSPASKSKSKDKRVAGREPQKSSTKPTSITNTGGSVPTSGYNPLLGTFHALETKDRIGNSVGMGIEYDSLSNSGGCTLTSQNRFTVMNMHANGFQHGPATTRSFNTSSHVNSVSNRQMYDHFHYQQQQPHLQHQYASSIATLDHHFSQQGSMNHYNNYGMWNRMVGSTTTTTPTLAHASSLRLFYRLRSNRCSGPSSPVVSGVVELFMSQIPQLSLTKYYYDNLDLEGPVEELLDVKKLEGLAQQLVAMIFSYERATMAIILNEGKVEQSVAWLFEGGKVKQQQVVTSSVEKRWPVGRSNPSVSYSFTSSLQAAPPPAKTYSRYAIIGTELKNLQFKSVREPVIMMQRPKSKHIPMILVHHRQHSLLIGIPVLLNRMVGSTTITTTPTLAHASSLGIFFRLGSNRCSGTSSPVGWNICDSLQFDYSNIDWSVGRLPLPSSTSLRTNGMWMSSINLVDHYALARGGKTPTRPPTGIMSNLNNGILVGGLHPDGVGAVGSETSVGGSRDCSSPFEQKELFSFLRQFVSFTSL
ncbi:UBA-like protein [Tanacetum coccineum]